MRQIFTHDMMSLNALLTQGKTIVVRLVPGGSTIPIQAVRQQQGNVQVQTQDGQWVKPFLFYIDEN